MQAFYFILAAIHMVAIVITGILWVTIDLAPKTSLRPHFRDIERTGIRQHGRNFPWRTLPECPKSHRPLRWLWQVPSPRVFFAP
jgi:hypothetical protein